MFIPIELVTKRKNEGDTSKYDLLADFADVVISGDSNTINEHRNLISNHYGVECVVEASANIGLFSMLDRIANATGIVLETPMLEASKDFRHDLKINQYKSAKNSLG